MASSGTPKFKFTANDGIVSLQKQVETINQNGGTRQINVEQEITLDQLHQRLFDDPTGLKEVRIDRTLDVTDIGEFFVNICTIPAGSKIRLIGFQILSNVVFGDDVGDSLAVGLSGGTINLYLQGAANLSKNYQISKMLADSIGLISVETPIDLCSAVLADNESGGNFVAGLVRVLVVYNTPAILPNV